jgi:microcystin-dependent protein
MATPPLITVPFAASGDQTVLPLTDPNGFVNFTTGYTPDYEINLAAGDPSAKAVERAIQNYLFNVLTNGMMYWQNYNRPVWYSGKSGGYGHYAEVVVLDGSNNPVPYRSLVAGNVSTPGSSTTWEYIQGSGEMISNIPMPSGGAGGPSSLLVTAATPFNSFVTSGTFQFATDAIVTGSSNAPANGGNAAGAGMLEVSAWTQSGTSYVTQFFRDRNGLAFMRGSTNGAWSVWKIWANAQQFVVGEVRMWSGTATQAAVTAAWGPGWHLCDGTLSTPDLRGQFIVGAGAAYANGATGGSATATLALANMPAHTHQIFITDNGHTHGTTQSNHTHAISDPGHAHNVYDPGHTHITNTAYVTNVGGSGVGLYGSPNTATANSISISGTGVSIYANGTGIQVVSNSIPITVNSATVNISAAAASQGSGTAFSILPPYYALCYVMYTGS